MKIDSNNLLSGDNIVQLDSPVQHSNFKSNLPDTIIIHYTAGSSAESSARYLCNEPRVSAHIVIGRQGEIFQIVPFSQIAYHAGNSFYGNRTMLNKYSIGIELDNAGILNKAGNEYQAWFGTKYQSGDVIQAIHRNESSHRYWHIYTKDQIDACRDVCSLLIEKFNIKNILGHEEISPGRKQDPGPAFPLDKLRNNLLYGNRSDDSDMIDKQGVVTANHLNIRSGSGVEFDKIAMPLTKGAKVKVVEEKDGWYKVETSITGWVGKAFISS